MSGRLAGKTALITGGSAGIGLASARDFLAEGARVAICGRSSESLAAARDTLGQDVLAVQADVASLADLDTLFATVRDEFGHLDVLFANAGYSQFRPFEEVTEDAFDGMIASNLKGTFFTIQKALPLLRPGSSVIITSSVVNHTGWPGTAVMSAVKAGQRSLARTIGGELIGRGIRVNSLSPGPTDTAMFGKMGNDTDGIRTMLTELNPSKRYGTAEEVAKLALYLASDESAYVVAADFAHDGGVGSI
jgi:NAD(P)-dependent dehydrogenase (short-subunit alcohol dehydrogenase family)